MWPEYNCATGAAGAAGAAAIPTRAAGMEAAACRRLAQGTPMARCTRLQLRASGRGPGTAFSGYRGSPWPEAERTKVRLGEPESTHYWTGTTCRITLCLLLLEHAAERRRTSDIQRLPRRRQWGRRGAGLDKPLTIQVRDSYPIMPLGQVWGAGYLSEGSIIAPVFQAVRALRSLSLYRGSRRDLQI